MSGICKCNKLQIVAFCDTCDMPLWVSLVISSFDISFKLLTFAKQMQLLLQKSSLRVACFYHCSLLSLHNISHELLSKHFNGLSVRDVEFAFSFRFMYESRMQVSVANELYSCWNCILPLHHRERWKANHDWKVSLLRSFVASLCINYLGPSRTQLADEESFELSRKM